VRRLSVSLLALVMLCAAGRPVSQAARAQQAPPSVESFIALARGYDVATIRRTFPAYNTGLFRLVFGSGTPIPLADEESLALFQDQRVRTPAGVTLDIGHVVTGIEAAAPLPSVARQIEASTGCQMRAAVTWSGDVGQALSDFVASGATDPEPFYNSNAPAEDLLGDVDGYLLGAEFGGPSPDVAAILTRAYLESDFEATRFSRFVALLGDDPAAFVARQVGCYATAFAALSGSPVDPDAIRQAVPYFVGRFLDFVREGARQESAAAGR
jgi:hypothetical protein